MKNHSRLLVVFAATVLLGSCTTRSSMNTQGRTVDLRQEKVEALLVPGWLNAKTLQIRRADEGREEDTLLIPGYFAGWRFYPSGGVEGALQQAPSDTNNKAAWLKLEDRELILIEAGATPPESPYLVGRFDYDTALFYPSDARVHPLASVSKLPAQD